MATWWRIIRQTSTADKRPIRETHPVRIIGKDLIPTIWPQHHAALGCGNVITEVAIDLLGDPTRLCTHMSLHQVPIDQVKVMAIGHGQKVLGSILVRYHGRSAHRPSSGWIVGPQCALPCCQLIAWHDAVVCDSIPCASPRTSLMWQPCLAGVCRHVSRRAAALAGACHDKGWRAAAPTPRLDMGCRLR